MAGVFAGDVEESYFGHGAAVLDRWIRLIEDRGEQLNDV